MTQRTERRDCSNENSVQISLFDACQQLQIVARYAWTSMLVLRGSVHLDIRFGHSCSCHSAIADSIATSARDFFPIFRLCCIDLPGNTNTGCISYRVHHSFCTADIEVIIPRHRPGSLLPSRAFCFIVLLGCQPPNSCQFLDVD
jgi:hypothetical protein